MRKLLLLAAVALGTATSALAVTTDATYEAANGLTMKNLWAITPNWDSETFNSVAALNSANGRTSCVLNGVVYVANLASPYNIEKFDAITGEYLGALTSGASGWYQNLNIGVDSYGNLFVTGLMSSTNFNLRVLNPEDGSVIGDVVNLAKTDDSYRVDYFDIVGDVTRTKDKCVIMGASSNTSTYVACWTAEKDGDFVYSRITCTDDNAFSTGAVLKIKLGEGDATYDAAQFWVDGNSQAPQLFNADGSVARKITAVSPDTGTQGFEEFTVGSHNLMAVSMTASKNGAATFSILDCSETTGDLTSSNTTELWNVTGLHGTKSDGSTYVHNLYVEKHVDANNKEAAILISQKVGNGLGAYLIAEEGFDDATVAIETVEVDANAPVEYYNLQGVKVANPESGLFIKKQGSKTTKVVL